jgi:hypothetical protein
MQITVEAVRHLWNQTVKPCAVVVVGSCEEDELVGKHIRVDYVSCPNFDTAGKVDLGAKIQAGIDYALAIHDPDALLFCGSDDMLSSRWIEKMVRLMTRYECVGAEHLYSVRFRPQLEILVSTYLGTNRYGEPMGPGRMISRQALDRIPRWKLYRSGIRSGADGASYKRLVASGAVVGLYEGDEAKVLSIKGEWEKLTNWNDLFTLPGTRKVRQPEEWLSSYFPEVAERFR